MGKGAPRHPPNCLNSLPCPQFRFNQFPLRNTFFYITIKLNRGLLTLPPSLCIDCLPTMSNGSWIVLLWTAQRPQQRVKSCEPIETTPSHILHRDINRSEEKQEQQQQQHYQQQQRKHPEPSSISRWSSSSALLFFCAYPAIHSRAGGHLTSPHLTRSPPTHNDRFLLFFTSKSRRRRGTHFLHRVEGIPFPSI